MARLVCALMASGFLFLIPGALTAQSVITFQYDTVIDTTPVGGGPGTPLRATFSFASDLLPGSGQFGTTPNAASYGPISLSLQIGTETVGVSGPGSVMGIGVFNDAGTTIVEDGYGVASYPEATYSGQLFGLDVQIIDIHIIDSDLDMFTSTDLPLSPTFATKADSSYVQVELRDSFGGTFLLSNFGENAPFSLTLPATPPPVCASTVTSLPALRAEVAALTTSQAAKDALNAILDQVQSALDAGLNDDARIGMSQFARAVVKRSTLDPSKPGSIPVSEANDAVCSASNVLIGIPGE